MSDLVPAHIPGCLEPELRQPLDVLARNIRVMLDATEANPVNIIVQNATTLQGESPEDFHDASQLTGTPAASTILLHEDTLEAELNSGATVSLGGKTLNGKYIRTGYKLPSGTLVGCLPNGTDYSIIAWNVCEALQ